jgi:hypothetical protein
MYNIDTKNVLGRPFFFEIGGLRLPFTLVNIWTDRAIFSNNKLSICRGFSF